MTSTSSSTEPPRGTAQPSRPPTRRRAWLACTTCRSRKTRCDAVKPRCSLCVTMDVECVYQDSQQPRVDPGIRMLLERIDGLEERLLSAPAFAGAPAPVPHPVYATTSVGNAVRTIHDHTNKNDPTAASNAPEIAYPLSHTASADHVLNWPIVQDLLSSSGFSRQTQEYELDSHKHGATDMFFGPSTLIKSSIDEEVPASWRLFADVNMPDVQEVVEEYETLIRTYFDEVNIFFPLLSLSELLGHLDRVADVETRGGDLRSSRPSTAQYCRLLLVLCLGAFVRSSGHRVQLPGNSDQGGQYTQPDPTGLHNRLWQKAMLLNGYVSAEVTVEAAQCTMLSSIYLGARGRIADAFHWSHVTSVKCVALVKSTSIPTRQPSTYSEAFRRLFWISFICESDFISEISTIQPSGIARYQDLVPYPTQAAPRGQHHTPAFPPESSAVNKDPVDGVEELAAFQISTNVAIRRLLNSIHSMVYDSKDHFRMMRVDYVRWLLRVAEDFGSYHGTIYRSVPQFLLASSSLQWGSVNLSDAQPQLPDGAPSPSSASELGSNPWNVLRLQGRYYASQHIIHRPFVDYVLLNMDQIQTHPDLEIILQKCKLCLEGCKGFISVFNVNEANSLTCLFATGMVTFTYLIVLRLATVCQIFQGILPDDIEQVIDVGRKNLELFGKNISEFKYHVEILNKLDSACRDRMAATR